MGLRLAEARAAGCPQSVRTGSPFAALAGDFAPKFLLCPFPAARGGLPEVPGAAISEGPTAEGGQPDALGTCTRQND